jgi:tagatose-1,6-bisphosphate aldolase
MIDPYEDLANAIVLLAVKDYRDALKKLMKHPRHESAKHTKAEVERFLRSDWYRELTSVDGDYLLKKIRSEVREP